jgi:hypothetical protein
MCSRCKTPSAAPTTRYRRSCEIVEANLRLKTRLGSRDSNPKFHVQSVTCYRYTTPQSDGYFTTFF